MSNTDIIIPELAVLNLDPSEWDCPHLSEIPTHERRDYYRFRLTPRVTSDMRAVWDSLVYKIYGGDEEQAARHALLHLMSCWKHVGDSTLMDRIITRHLKDKVTRDSELRQKYEIDFQTNGDIVSHVINTANVVGAYNILNEWTQVMTRFHLIESKWVYLDAARNSVCVRDLVDFLFESGGRFAEIASKWIEGWESLPVTSRRP